MSQFPLSDTSKEFTDLVREKLTKQFPHSEIRIFAGEDGSLKVSVEGIKVFDWSRIKEYLAELPAPKKPE